MSAIKVSNLAKYFSPPKKGKQGKIGPNGLKGIKNMIRAVDDISFEVKKGEIFGD